MLIRPFVSGDLEAAHQLFDIDLQDANFGSEKMTTIEERAEWLQWSILNYRQLNLLHQPPYGDRAIILKANGSLIGSCGYVPSLNAFEQLPGFPRSIQSHSIGWNSPEFGLFYAISPIHQRHGYAVEAAQALIDYAFSILRIKRIIAETDHDNLDSISVMRRLGMQIYVNPHSEPAHLQVVGVLENDLVKNPDAK